MCSLLDALTNVSSPAASAFLTLLLRRTVLLGEGAQTVALSSTTLPVLCALLYSTFAKVFLAGEEPILTFIIIIFFPLAGN